MNLASKENSLEFPEAARRLKSEQQPRGTQKEERRVALSAKPLNTDSHISTGSPKRNTNRKRSSIDTDRLSRDAEFKRSRVESSVEQPFSKLLSDSEDQTDEDEEQQVTEISKKTPESKLSARRAESFQRVMYPRIKLADMPDLDVDYPLADDVPPMEDNGEEMLEGFDFTAVKRLQNPLLTPKFMADFERNSKMRLEDFPELEYTDAESDSLSTIGLDTPDSTLRLHHHS